MVKASLLALYSKQKEFEFTVQTNTRTSLACTEPESESWPYLSKISVGGSTMLFVLQCSRSKAPASSKTNRRIVKLWIYN